VPIVVIASGLLSDKALLLSYAPPSITAVKGCTDSNSSTINCPRVGGLNLTVTGTNFGASNALILVGGTLCSPTKHALDVVLAHSTLFCTLPAGSSQSNAVLVLQSGSQISNNSQSLSYATCPAGMYQASATDYACTSCAAGTITSAAGLVRWAPRTSHAS
jgi:hypothetical protein